VSVLTGPSSGSTSSLAKVTTVYYFPLYTYIDAVEACFLVLSYACVFLFIRVLYSCRRGWVREPVAVQSIYLPDVSFRIVKILEQKRHVCK